MTALVIVFLLSASFPGCGDGSGATGGPGYRSSDDDDAGDDDAGDDVAGDDTEIPGDDDSGDEDDSEDDDSSDDTGSSDSTIIKSPLDGFIYYSSRILSHVSDKIEVPGASLLLDGLALDPVMIQWIRPDDGAHELLLRIGGITIARSNFQVRAGEVGKFSSESAVSLPATISLPTASGSATPVMLSLKNNGDETATFLSARTSGQPDFTSRQSLTDYLLAETAGMTEKEKAVYLYDFVIKNANSHKTPYGALDLPDQVPQFFSMWGFGECGNQARILAALAQLTGTPHTMTRIYYLTGHVVAELAIGGSWHMFDPSTNNFYPNDSGRILSVAEIEQDPDLILDYTDQLGQSMGFGDMEIFVPLFESTDDNHIEEAVFDFGNDSEIRLQPGDRVEFYPFGFGVRTCVDCLYDSTIVGTGSLAHAWTDAEIEDGYTVEAPFPFAGLAVYVSSQKSAGSANLLLTLHGSLGSQTYSRTVETGGAARYDLTAYFHPEDIGIISRMIVSFEDATEPIESVSTEGFFQFGARWFPQVDHDRLDFIVNGTGENLAVEMDVYDRVEPIAQATLAVQGYPDGASIPSDGKHFVSLEARLLGADGKSASGHRYTVISDHPEAIEILSNPRPGMQGNEAVVTPFSGPIRSRSNYDGLIYFFARSIGRFDESIGTVKFTLLADGSPAATRTVEFIAP